MFFTEFSDKNCIILKRLLGSNPYISCVRGRDSTTVPRTQLTEKTVKLILIHASVDSLSSVKSVQFRENPNRSLGCEIVSFSTIR